MEEEKTPEELKEEKKARKLAKKEAERAEVKSSRALEHKRNIVYDNMCRRQRENRKEEKSYPEDSFISLQNVNKIYSNRVQAVFDFNIEIKEHEFIVFVGPSGCGKSTTLRMIAGLEDITYGDLFIDGEYANDLEPKDRNVAMVFQSYALYPHMTVYQNMAFGLQMRHINKEEIDERVKRAAEILQLSDYLDRKPAALSGGQRQRVALGRAIVRNTKIFLMDEPLSNLDAKLRVQMRTELVNLHNELGSTTIYVTHDQTEAMTMASRIVVMNKGVIQQIGTPKEIYSHPENVFVASFIGSPSMNIMKADYDNGTITFENGYSISLGKDFVTKHDDFYNHCIMEEEARIKEIADLLLDDFNANPKKYKKTGEPHPDDDEEIIATKDRIEIFRHNLKEGKHPILIGIRPEDVIDASIGSKKHLSKDLSIKVRIAELLGNEYFVHLGFCSSDLVARMDAGNIVNNGDVIKIGLDLDKIKAFDYITEKAILK